MWIPDRIVSSVPSKDRVSSSLGQDFPLPIPEAFDLTSRLESSLCALLFAWR